MMMERLSNVNISFTNNNKYTFDDEEDEEGEVDFFPIIYMVKMCGNSYVEYSHNIHYLVIVEST